MLIRRSIVALATVALVAGAAAAPVASAAGAQPKAKQDVRLALTGGVTMLKLNAGTAGALTANSISVAPASEAKVGASGIEFPIQGGLLNPYTLAGTITHDGGLTFRAGGKSLTIRDFTVNVGGHRLTAWVDEVGARIPVLDLDLSKAKVSAGATSLGVSGVVATLDSAAAKALNGYFGTTLFSKGLTIGTVRVGAIDRVLHTS
jgi:hypothetical protein